MIRYVTRGRGAQELLPKQVAVRLRLLMSAIEEKGPVRGDWSHYGKLSDNKHHCHLKKGHPTYVVVWKEKGKAKVVDQKNGQVNVVDWIEVIYAGTHENAPY